MVWGCGWTDPDLYFHKTGISRLGIQCLERCTPYSCVEKEEIPAELNYGSSDRIGDIVVAPELGWQFTDVPRALKGAHGYFPQSPDMQVMFRACGPDFKAGYESKDLSMWISTRCWPIYWKLLRKTDGQFERIKDILKDVSFDNLLRVKSHLSVHRARWLKNRLQFESAFLKGNPSICIYWNIYRWILFNISMINK